MPQGCDDRGCGIARTACTGAQPLSAWASSDGVTAVRCPHRCSADTAALTEALSLSGQMTTSSAQQLGSGKRAPVISEYGLT